MDKDKLIQRQKEITKKLGAKPEAGRGRMSWKHRKKLNEELREINQKLRAFPDYKSLLRPRKKTQKEKRRTTATSSGCLRHWINGMWDSRRIQIEDAT